MEDYDVNVEMIWVGTNMDHALFYSQKALLGVFLFCHNGHMRVSMIGALP